MKMTNWVLLADGSRAQLYLKEGDDHREWTLLKDFDHPPARQAGQDLVGNRPYRIQHQMEATAKGVQGPQTLREDESERFAQELVDYLHGAASRNEFGTLVVAAAPRFLGSLRAKLTKPVKERVSHYLARNYASMAPDAFAEHLTGL